MDLQGLPKSEILTQMRLHKFLSRVNRYLLSYDFRVGVFSQSVKLQHLVVAVT